VKAKFPDTQVIVAEPKDYDDHALSLRAGRREAHHAKARTICDALMAEIPVRSPLRINGKLLSGGRHRVRRRSGAAMAFAFREIEARGRAGRAWPRRAAADRSMRAARTSWSLLSGAMSDADLFAKLIA